MIRISSHSFLLAVLLSASVCWPQTNVGRISGSVRDSSGASVPGCTVTVTNPATGFQQIANTDSAGFFVFPSLPAGTYNLRVDHPPFKTTAQTHLVLHPPPRRP